MLLVDLFGALVGGTGGFEFRRPFVRQRTGNPQQHALIAVERRELSERVDPSLGRRQVRNAAVLEQLREGDWTAVIPPRASWLSGGRPLAATVNASAQTRAGGC